MKNKNIFIFDGPPASGKTTLSKILAQKLRCPYIRYKALGLANIISTIILRLAPKYSINSIKPIRIRQDPILLLTFQLLKKMRWITFLTELFYKIFYVMPPFLLFIIYDNLVIDEFLTLRIANYFNVHSYGGLSKWQAELLMRMDLALLITFAKYGKVCYIYIDRHIDELKNLWRKRERDKEYSEEYLVLVRSIWKMYNAQISTFAKIRNPEVNSTTLV